MQVVVLLVAPPRSGAVDGEQPAGSELTQDADNSNLGDRPACDDLPHERQSDRAVEDGEPPEHGRLVEVQEDVAAACHRAQLVVAFDDDLVEAIKEVADRHRGQLRGDELQRERQPATSAHQRGDVRGEAVVEAQSATSLANAVHQQPDLRVGQQRVDLVCCRRWKRLDGNDPFAVDHQRHPACHDQGEVRAGGKQVGRQRGDAVDDYLAAV